MSPTGRGTRGCGAVVLVVTVIATAFGPLGSAGVVAAIPSTHTEMVTISRQGRSYGDGSAAAYVIHTAKLLGPVTKRTGCVSKGGLPDPACTPGATDPRVTQSDLDQTICRAGGYTSTVRPPESYTEALKREQIPAYGDYAGPFLSAYEEDHLVSLELGGSPDSPANLWPEAHHDGRYGSYVKDRIENRLHAQVCRRTISLSSAQHEIATNWKAA